MVTVHSQLKNRWSLGYFTVSSEKPVQPWLLYSPICKKPIKPLLLCSLIRKTGVAIVTVQSHLKTGGAVVNVQSHL